MGRLGKVIVVLLPLAAFVGVVLQVRALMDEGQGLFSLLCLLGALAVLALVEGVIFKCWILPPVAGELSERVYAGGGYTPAEDALLCCVGRIREERQRELLPELERLVLADARRARAWQEYAHVLCEVFADAPAALGVLRRGVERVRDREDRAMLLCRAAYLAQDSLHDAALAQELYREAAQRFPRTSYGKFALGKVNR